MRSFLVALIACSLPVLAEARTVEPGKVMGAVGVGAGFKYGSVLGGSGGFFLLQARGEYTIDPALSAVADFTWGNLIFGTVPLRLRAGGRYRLTGLDLPLSPYAQAQLSYTRLIDVLGANLNALGIFLGLGADYFLTAQMGAGVLIGTDMSGTFSDRSAFFGTIDITAYASYTF